MMTFVTMITPAPGVLCKAMLEMNKMDERGVKQSSAHYVYNASWTPMPNHLAIPEPVPRALVVLLGLPILNFSSLRSCGAAGAEPRSPARSTLGKSHTSFVHVVAAL